MLYLLYTDVVSVAERQRQAAFLGFAILTRQDLFTKRQLTKNTAMMLSQPTNGFLIPSPRIESSIGKRKRHSGECDDLRQAVSRLKRVEPSS